MPRPPLPNPGRVGEGKERILARVLANSKPMYFFLT